MGSSRDIDFVRQLCRSGEDIVSAMPVAAEALRRLVPSFSLSMIRVDAHCAPQRHYSEFFDEYSHGLFGTAGHLIAAATDDPAAFGRLLRNRGRPYGTLIDNRPEYLDGATYRMLFQRNGIHHCLDVAIRESDRPLGILGIFRERGTRPFTARDVQVIDALYPHLVHACAAEPMPSLFDEIDSAMLVTDLQGRVQWASAQARRWLVDALEAPAQASLLRQDQLPEACRELGRRWRDGETARRSHGGAAPVPALSLPVPGGRLRLRAYGLARPGESTRQIGIQLHLEMSRPLRVMRVLESSTLSPQQRRIAFGLWKGRSTAELRAELNIGSQTLRSYQKDLYARLDVGSAAELVRVLDARARQVTLDLARHQPRAGVIRRPGST